MLLIVTQRALFLLFLFLLSSVVLEGVYFLISFSKDDEYFGPFSAPPYYSFHHLSQCKSPPGVRKDENRAKEDSQNWIHIHNQSAPKWRKRGTIINMYVNVFTFLAVNQHRRGLLSQLTFLCSRVQKLSLTSTKLQIQLPLIIGGANKRLQEAKSTQNDHENIIYYELLGLLIVIWRRQLAGYFGESMHGAQVGGEEQTGSGVYSSAAAHSEWLVWLC